MVCAIHGHVVHELKARSYWALPARVGQRSGVTGACTDMFAIVGHGRNPWIYDKTLGVHGIGLERVGSVLQPVACFQIWLDIGGKSVGVRVYVW